MKKSKIVLSLCSLLFVVSLLVSSVDAYASESFYTYTYDYWFMERQSPDAYTTHNVIFADDYGIGNLKDPLGLFVEGDMVYVCDTGNSRIVEFKYENDAYTLVKQFSTVLNNGVEENLSAPEDVFITDTGDYYICDTGNQRVVHTDKNLNVITVVVKPDDITLSKDFQFLPSKCVVDSANRLYVQARNVNKGFMEFDTKGGFVGYVGANEVTYDPLEMIWKKVATKAQRAQLQSFVPTEYNNLSLDSDGFIYATTSIFGKNDLLSGAAMPIRKLNANGKDILVRNGYSDPVGDLQWADKGTIKGSSKFTDITVMDSDSYFVTDKTRGRIFGYDFQGNLLYAFGGIGNKAGLFQNLSAIDNMGESLLILDQKLGSITHMTLTNYGEMINTGISEYKKGNYEESAVLWKQVLKLNGNYDLAYIGIGRALLRQEKYKEAMDYFKLKNDDVSYSKAFKMYRKEWIEDHIHIIFGIIIALIVLVNGKNFIVKMRKEVNEE